MPAEISLLDTNILVYSVLSGSEKHIAARRLLEQANVAGAGLCVCSQVLAEFFAVVTDPRRVSNSREPEEALGVSSRRSSGFRA
jgi:predicted nucleic acid-binding protein